MVHNPPTTEEIALYVDQPTALGRVRGNIGLYKRMLGLFLSGKEFAQFEDALSASDLSTAADAAHSIKGMTGNLALTRLFEASTTLMEQLRAGKRDDAAIEEYRSILEDTRVCVQAVINQPGR